MSDTPIVKGSRIRARWFVCHRVSLAGVMAKSGATEHSVSGVVRHVRGDHPDNPTVIRLYVESDDGLGTPCGNCQVREVEVDPAHVIEIDGVAVRSKGVVAA